MPAFRSPVCARLLQQHLECLAQAVREEGTLRGGNRFSVMSDDVSKSKNVGTKRYMAPEVLDGTYASPIDIYSTVQLQNMTSG